MDKPSVVKYLYKRPDFKIVVDIRAVKKGGLYLLTYKMPEHKRFRVRGTDYNSCFRIIENYVKFHQEFIQTGGKTRLKNVVETIVNQVYDPVFRGFKG